MKVTDRERPGDASNPIPGLRPQQVDPARVEPARAHHRGDETTVELASETATVRTIDFDAFCEREHRTLARALALALDDRELGRDAAAEALSRAWSRWSSVSQMDNAAGWVYRVGLNWGRSRLRRHRREVTTAFPPELGASAADFDDGLAAALAQLSADHRAVVVARYYLDWSEATTADALGIPPGTVKSRLSRALTQLDEHLRSDP